MTNVLFDVTDNIVHLGLPVTPYIGAGAGLTSISWDGADRYGTVKNLYALGYTQDYSNLFNKADTVGVRYAFGGPPASR